MIYHAFAGAGLALLFEWSIALPLANVPPPPHAQSGLATCASPRAPVDMHEICCCQQIEAWCAPWVRVCTLKLRFPSLGGARANW